MEDAYFIEQKNGDTTTFALADLGAKAAEEGFDVFPGDVRAGRVSEDRFKCSLMGALHVCIVPERSTGRNRCVFGCLTFELSGRRRQDARARAEKMCVVPQTGPWWPAVGAPLERLVRPHCWMTGRCQRVALRLC